MLIKNIRVMNDSRGRAESKDVLVDQAGRKEIFDAKSQLIPIPETCVDKARGAPCTSRPRRYTSDEVTQYTQVSGIGMTMMPGLFDTHVHGQGGFDFADVGEHPETLPLIMKALGQTGLSYAMATLVSLKIPTLVKALQVIDAYFQQQESNPMPGFTRIVGIHLEGPFIAKDCKGAHDILALQDSISLSQFKEIISNAPHIHEWKMTIAPDLPGAQEFIRDAKELEKEGISVKVFLGHTNPDKDQIQNAIDAGAVGFTHLGNACMETCCREMRALEVTDATSHLVQWVLENPESCPPGVELIVDGVHLSQTFVSLVKGVIGNKILLVTDALGPSGLADGNYKLGTLDIQKKGNSFYLLGSTKLAGSAAPLSHCIHTYAQWTKCDDMGTEEDLMKSIYFAAVENPRISSLSKKALEKLPEDKNFSIFNAQGELVMSLCNGEFIEHQKGKS
jgi:N-acetylglucosamine-6-phosphate deacetylase